MLGALAAVASLAAVAALTSCCFPPPTGPAGAGAGSIASPQPPPLGPLTEPEQAACARIAIQRVFKDTLGQDRYTVLSQAPVIHRSRAGYARACGVEIFDYTKNVDLQATVDLVTSEVVSSRQLKDVQPAVGVGEIAVARSVAESSAETRERLRPILVRPLEDLEVTAMVRTDGKTCRTHRCVELDFYETGPTAGNTSAAEPTSAQVTWRPIKPLGRVIIDLTQIAVVSLEVF